jgi:hypothetical protein
VRWDRRDEDQQCLEDDKRVRDEGDVDGMVHTEAKHVLADHLGEPLLAGRCACVRPIVGRRDPSALVREVEVNGE